MTPRAVIVVSVILAAMLQPRKSFPQEVQDPEDPENLPVYLRDRGTGIPMSIFGTYVRKGELLVYPFYEYIRDDNLEYEPADFGLPSKQEFRGRLRAHEALIFIGYGITDRLAIEFEAGVITAKFNKSDMDRTAVPSEIQESGVSDVEGQIRWRWNHESEGKPEVFNYFEYVFPTGEKHSLIGTSHWEFKFGLGLIKGFSWGTLTFRVAGNYTTEENKFEPGEYAFEYLKRISDRFRFFAMLEGEDDEVALVPEIQWHVTSSIFVKANIGFGVTSKATDFAPEVGIVFSFN